MSDDLKLHSEHEAGRIIGRAPRTMARWRREGTGPAYINIQGRPMYRRRDIALWIEANAVKPVRSRGE